MRATIILKMLLTNQNLTSLHLYIVVKKSISLSVALPFTLCSVFYAKPNACTLSVCIIMLPSHCD